MVSVEGIGLEWFSVEGIGLEWSQWKELVLNKSSRKIGGHCTYCVLLLMSVVNYNWIAAFIPPCYSC